MCGRFTRGVESKTIVTAFEIEAVTAATPPSYNVCPGQAVAAIAGQGPRKLGQVRWGLPFPGGASGRPVINARAETLADKPMFSRLLADRRCLIVADGFYEWRVEGGRKQPVYIYLKDRRPFGFAALWDRPAAGAAGDMPAGVIVTTQPNGLLAPIHNRMPAILPPKAIVPWLDPGIRDPGRLLELLQPYPEAAMACHPVSPRVNTPQHDVPDLIEPEG